MGNEKGEATIELKNALKRASVPPPPPPLFPGCNVRSDQKNVRFWCADKSGDGKVRGWHGFPRQGHDGKRACECRKNKEDGDLLEHCVENVKRLNSSTNNFYCIALCI